MGSAICLAICRYDTVYCPHTNLFESDTRHPTYFFVVTYKAWVRTSRQHSPMDGRVASLKLLGVHIVDDLRWSTHIKSICSKANSRIYFLKLIKRAGLPPDALLCYYTTVIRPLLEYACVVWHHGLTLAQSDQLERLQKTSYSHYL
jgi:hypothetical protein